MYAMYADFAPKLARILTEYSQPVQPGNVVGMRGTPEALPLIKALYEAVLRQGGHPVVEVKLPGLTEIKLAHASDEQLTWSDPFGLHFIEHVDVFYAIHSDPNPRALSGYPAGRMTLRHQGLRPWLEAYHRRFADGSLRWTICAWPTNGYAQAAEMSLYDYTDFVYRACAFDQPDPVAHWVAFRERQDRLCAWLNGKRHCQVRGPGIDLSFDFTDRLWVNAHGDLNFPDGEIYTGPVEDSVNGHVAFSYPAVYDGRAVSGVRLTFADGVVTAASAERGEDYLLSTLDLDEGARRLGEFAIGTNAGIQQFTGSTLFDEKIGGTIHMAVGRSIPMTRGQVESALHWDMVHGMQDGGEILIDGELFYQGGKFMIE